MNKRLDGPGASTRRLPPRPAVFCNRYRATPRVMIRTGSRPAPTTRASYWAITASRAKRYKRRGPLPRPGKGWESMGDSWMGKGMRSLRRQQRSWRVSDGVPLSASKSCHPMRQLVSGRATTTGPPLHPALFIRLRSSPLSVRPSATFSSVKAGVMSAEGRGSDMPCVTSSPRDVSRARHRPIRPLSISSPQAPVMILHLREGHPIDLLQGRDSGIDLVQGRLAQRGRTLLTGDGPDLCSRSPVQDRLSDAIGDLDQLKDPGPTPIAGVDALGAPLSLEEGDGWRFGKSRVLQQRGGRGRLDLAMQADQADETLGQDTVERRDKIVRLEPHVDQAADDIDDVIGVHRGKYQVTGQGRLDRDLSRLRVSDFSDHDLVGIVAKDRPEAPREREPLLFIHRDLHHILELVLDGILDGDDLVLPPIDLADGGIQRCRLAAPGGAGDQDHPVGPVDRVPESLHVGFGEPEPLELELTEFGGDGFLIQDPDDHGLAEVTRHDRHPKVDRPPVEAKCESAVLGNPALGDVQLGHDLDPRDDRLLVAPVQRLHRRIECSVNPVLDEQMALGPLQMDVARPPVEGV